MLFNFDQANQQLNITIPQAWWRGTQKTGPHPPHGKKVSPVPDGLQLVCQQLPPTGWQQQPNLNAYGTAGINTGAWRLRSIIS